RPVAGTRHKPAYREALRRGLRGRRCPGVAQLKRRAHMSVVAPVVTVEEQGPISIIRINRPARLNAINSAVAIELQAAFKAFDRSEQRVAVLSAAGPPALTPGADVSDLPELWRCIPNVGFKTGKPIIAATSGWCVGGGLVMVMMCDLMVSTEDTQFYYPEAKLGLTGGMISSLARRMPHKLAMEVMLLGSKVP